MQWFDYDFEKALVRIKKDEQYYKKAQRYNLKSAYKNYLEEFPNGIFKKEAEKKINELPNDSTFTRLGIYLFGMK